jgi:hypothetical protein
VISPAEWGRRVSGTFPTHVHINQGAKVGEQSQVSDMRRDVLDVRMSARCLSNIEWSIGVGVVIAAL